VFGPHDFSPSELAALLAAERRGVDFVAHRDGNGDLRLRALEGAERLTIGRLAENDLVLDWDSEVSRVHSRLERLGGGWTVVDDGLSRNGTFVNGERVHGRRLLGDGDVLRFGHTTALFRSPVATAEETAAASDGPEPATLTPAERRVLVALCRPFAMPEAAAAPATNREIALELTLSLDGVKKHMRALFEKLAIEPLPQNRKRAELARRALSSGLVTMRDLRVR
jgi:pSer/pThr/pTyr-binding forkhead associated (FHA) protein/DNA-binding CsgD family transcriptional regulator